MQSHLSTSRNGISGQDVNTSPALGTAGRLGLVLALLAACATGVAGAWLYGVGASDADTPRVESAVGKPEATSARQQAEVSRATQQIAEKNESAVLALQKQLQQEQAATLELQRKLSILETDVETLQSELQQSSLAADTSASEGEEADSSPQALALESIQGHESAGFDSPNSRLRNSWQDEDSESRVENLVNVGLDVSAATRLAGQIDQQKLAELELRDQASREGWRESERFEEELDEIRESTPDLRAELGDQAYDQYRFQTGRGNRVEIRSIIAGSAADAAGLQRGDIVLEYAGARVFAVRELQDATRAGSRGESVSIRLLRDEQALDTSIVRGPLGVTLMPRLIAPGES